MSLKTEIVRPSYQRNSKRLNKLNNFQIDIIFKIYVPDNTVLDPLTEEIRKDLLTQFLIDQS